MFGQQFQGAFAQFKMQCVSGARGPVFAEVGHVRAAPQSGVVGAQELFGIGFDRTEHVAVVGSQDRAAAERVAQSVNELFERTARVVFAQFWVEAFKDVQV